MKTSTIQLVLSAMMLVSTGAHAAKPADAGSKGIEKKEAAQVKSEERKAALEEIRLCRSESLEKIKALVKDGGAKDPAVREQLKTELEALKACVSK